jgi:N-acetylmuramoyl-L-alanine amidase
VRRALARFASLLAAALALLGAAVRSAAAQAPDSLRIATRSGVVAVPAAPSATGPAYPAAALRALGAQVQPSTGGARVVLFGDTLSFTELSPYFRAGDDVAQLSAPFHGPVDAAVWPRQLFLDWLPAHYPRHLTVRGGMLVLDGASPAAATVAAAAPGRVGRQGDAAGEDSVDARRLVVLDPGHGGIDPGRIGPDGILEKDVTLAISKKLATILRRRGYDVRLTRTRDTLIALADRPRMANRWKAGRPAAIFMSIHANASREQAQGYETYFLSEARTDDERRVAEMENAAVAYEGRLPAPGQGDVGAILNNLRNDFYVRASDDLAEIAQKELGTFDTAPDRGVKQAGFVVLIGAFMPAVLVETGFISDPQEAHRLATPSYQEKIAGALADAIDRFFDTHEHLWRSAETR